MHLKRIETIDTERLRKFFNPSSIALVGATDKSKWSLFTFSNLQNLKFQGSIYCVNPNRKRVHGRQAYKSLLEIDEPVDLAFIMVPTKIVLDVMKDAATKNIQNLVILTAGFSETGEEGKRLETEILEFAQKHDQLILGPNGNGFINVSQSIVPYGLPVESPIQSGPVGVVLQSGALASSIIKLSKSRKIDFSFLISMGNELMISATDIVDYLIEDEDTRVIAMFLESIRDPKEFIRIARKAILFAKPLVVFKIGRSEESARSAMAHTGSLVGNDAVNDAMFRQLGVIRVNSLEDLVTTAGLLGYYPALKGRRIGIVTSSGGACDILADRAKDEKLSLPSFQPQTIENLQQVLPSFSTIHNPLDVTGYVVVDRSLLRNSLKAVAEDSNLDFVLCVTEPPSTEKSNRENYEKHFYRLSNILHEAKIPIITMMNTGIDIEPFGKEIVEKYGLHFLGGMEHGMTAVGNAVWWYEKYDRLKEQSHSWPVKKVNPNIKIVEDVAEWSEYQARNFLQKSGVPFAPGILVDSVEEAVVAAQKVGFPVVLKVQSKHIAHKSDIGGVALDLESADKVKEAYVDMMNRVKKHVQNSQIDGVLVTPMRANGIELLVGIVKDPLWGPVLAVGFGGIFVEVLKDTSLRVLPVNQAEIKSMLYELRGAELFKGVRRKEPVNVDRLTEVIYNITKIAVNHSDYLKELEINPLWIKGKKIEALDALIKWNQTSPILSD